MKNWGLDQIGFTVVPTLIFDMTKAKALHQKYMIFIFYKSHSVISKSPYGGNLNVPGSIPKLEGFFVPEVDYLSPIFHFSLLYFNRPFKKN